MVRFAENLQRFPNFTNESFRVVITWKTRNIRSLFPLQSDSHLLKKLFYLLRWKSFKMMKNASYLILKTLLFSRYLIFVLTFWSCRKNRLIRKTNFKIYDVTTWLTITINILSNILQSKGNETIEFGQLIEYDKTNIFLQISCRKWGRETSSRPLFVFKKVYIR